MDEILIACGDVELLRRIVGDLPPDRFKPIATRSGGGIAKKVAGRDVKLAIVHDTLGDGPGLALCQALRDHAANLPILYLTSGAADADGPFDRALRFPIPGPVFRNVVNDLAPPRETAHDLAAWKAFYEELGQRLETLGSQTYYAALGLPDGAGHQAVVAAYDQASLRFHPDRYNQFRHERWGAAIYDRANELYKELTEGFSILTDRRLRKLYDRAIAEGRLRLSPDEKSAQDTGPDLLENHAQSPQGKKFLRLAQQDLARGDWSAALQNLRFAQSMEGDLPAIMERIALCEQKLKS